MKVKIFTTSSWNASNLESEANRWLEKNDVDIINIKIAGTKDRAIFVLIYEEKPTARPMSVKEYELRESGEIIPESDGSFADFIKSAAAYVDAARTAYDTVAKKCSCMTCKYRLIDSDICSLTKERIGNKICFNYERT